jgi:hypothetical protein
LTLFICANGSGIDYINDNRSLSTNEAKKIVQDTLREYSITKLDFYDYPMAKFFIAKFLDKGVKIKHIEKIFKIGHYRIKRILAS